MEELTEDLPEIFNHEKVSIVFVRGQGQADLNKFIWIPEEGDEYYFTLDDDILYPDDYVNRTLAKLQEHRGCIVTYHGRILQGQNLPYYTAHKANTFAQGQYQDIKIDVAGTGVSAFDTRYFRPIGLSCDDFVLMSDLGMSLYAAREKVAIISCIREYGWIRSLENNDKRSIFEVFRKKDTPIHNRIANQIYQLNHHEN
jgi:hypothetical protein